ncbi:hypothetical protein I4U23_027013 [Adineta vaga]|nr:hypothetical protein I4U23_027013 [Adineta vaga]
MQWTGDVWLSEWSPYQSWFVGSTYRLMIDSKGQPINIPTHELKSNVKNISWMTNFNHIKLIVTREEKVLTFFK